MVLAELPESKSLSTSLPQSHTSHLLVHVRPSSSQPELPELGQVVGDGEGDEGGQVAGDWPPRVNQLSIVKFHAFMFYVLTPISCDNFLLYMSHIIFRVFKSTAIFRKVQCRDQMVSGVTLK